MSYKILDVFVLEKALESDFKDKKITEAFRTISDAYFAEYEDAETFDFEAETSLRTLFDICFPCGENNEGLGFEEICKKSS